MIRVLKDSYKLSLLITTIFFVSILVSAYVLYSLPHNLIMDGSHSALTETYIVVAISFLLGATAVYFGLKSNREVIVYKDRSMDSVDADKNASGDENKTTITLDGVKASLRQTDDEKESLKIGLQAICKQLDAGQGALYLASESDGHRKLELKSGYALSISESATLQFDFGEGLIGQSAANGRALYVDDVPEGYIKIISGLGSASPRYLLISPIKKEEKVVGVIEIASFSGISEDQRKFVEESAQLLAEKIKITNA